MEDGSWCKYKVAGGNPGPAPRSEAKSRSGADWDVIGKQKALCGMVNAMLASGKAPADVAKEMVALNGLFQKVETLSGTPASKPASAANFGSDNNFKPPVLAPRNPAPSDDYEAGNKAIEDAQVEQFRQSVADGIEY
jgi:hypothetical protein